MTSIPSDIPANISLEQITKTGMIVPLHRGGAIMSSLWAPVVCATGLWVIVIAAAHYEPAKRPAGEAWVVTASEKMPSRPALARAHMPYKTADVR